MSKIEIPGSSAQYVIVRDSCRDLHGDDGAISLALEKLERAARAYIKNWPKGHGTQFHFVITVERGSGER